MLLIVGFETFLNFLLLDAVFCLRLWRLAQTCQAGKLFRKKRNLSLIRVILSVGFNTNQRENSEINYFLKFIKCLTLRMSLYLLSLIGILVIIIIQQLCKVFTSLTTNGVIIHSVHVLQCVLEIVSLASETN